MCNQGCLHVFSGLLCDVNVFEGEEVFEREGQREVGRERERERERVRVRVREREREREGGGGRELMEQVSACKSFGHTCSP